MRMARPIYPDIQEQILEYLDKLEKVTGKTLGDPEKPLLVSVRSGARASMPGMMDTILNLGMNDEICEAVAKLTNNPRFARDSYRRFIQMFSDVVMEAARSPPLSSSSTRSRTRRASRWTMSWTQTICPS